MSDPFGTGTLRARIAEFHALLRDELPGVLRIGVALHEPRTGMLRTFAHSTVGPPPFDGFAQPLAESPSLAALAKGGGLRVIDDLDAIADPPAWHARALRDHGFRSSLTKPVMRGGQLAAFLFFDASTPGYFGADVVRRLDALSQQLAFVVLHGLDVVQVLEAALRTGAVLTRFRDVETADHVERVSRYARLIAQAVAPRWSLSDDMVEAVALFAIAHDIGKVAVPESVLGKHGPLDAAETERMKTHTTAGAAIVDGIVRDLGLAGHAHLSVLRNVVLSHHELLDGSGYPDRLAGDAIPIEARIVVVADVYDALRSHRPYKAPWSSQEVLAYLRGASGALFEPACVEAAYRNAAQFEEIRRVVS